MQQQQQRPSSPQQQPDARVTQQQGKGEYSMEYLKHMTCTREKQEEIIAKYKEEQMKKQAGG